MSKGIRVNVMINEELLKKIDKRADELNISRSSFIALCCNTKFEQDEAMKQIPNLLLAVSDLKSISDNLPAKKTAKK